MLILGISAWYHDSAACLIRDGVIVAAAQEERFTRKKHDPAFPSQAILYCLRQGEIDPEALDGIVFYEKPFPKFERLVETYLAFAPRGFRSFAAAMPLWIKDKLFQKARLIEELEAIFGKARQWKEILLFSEHHLSHAASAFYPSPFERAAILTLDAVGEWATTSWAIGCGSDLRIERELHFPHSLGLLYSAFTHHAGFKVNSGEYKLMGLAPYGEPRFAGLIREHLVDVRPDGSFRLDMRYFDYCTGLTMTNRRFEALFGGPARRPETELTQREMDLAASIQTVTEDIILKLTRTMARETGLTDLCLAGGVALNCVANGAVLRDGAFERIWVQPAAGDAGGALGAALAVHHIAFGVPRQVPPGGDGMKGGFLGPEFTADEVRERLTTIGARFEELDDDAVIERTARALAAGEAVGWMQGRMEFGPRALGARSIIADPRSPAMQRQLNLKVKFRESFRPFAPSVLREHLSDWFDLDADSPYMTLVAQVAEERQFPVDAPGQALSGLARLEVQRSVIPAVTHVDGSARIQTVHRETNPRYHALISRFNALTGCPLLVNTSFNVRGEPVVCTPEDAFGCFMATELDMLVIGNAILIKSNQNPGLKDQYQVRYALD
jgi:carbamoyltransferase